MRYPMDDVGVGSALLVTMLSVSVPAYAQAPAFLVKDINTQPVVASSDPRDFLAIGDTVFFVAQTAEGLALWRVDGTAGGAVRLTPGVNLIRHLVDVNGSLFFVVNDAELWKSDGTAAGTVRIAEIPPISDSFPVDYEEASITLGDVLFFVTGGISAGFELWRSDGTAAGTLSLKRVDPVGQGGPVPITRVLNGAVLFSAWDDATGYELWKTDGTPAGTVLVRDLVPGPDSSHPELMAAVGGRLLFGAYGPNTSSQLWSTDGSGQGTLHISNAEPWRGSLGYYATVGDTLFFAGSVVVGNAGYQRLWRSDGTAAGTRLVDPAQTTTGVTPFALAAADGTLFFTGQAEQSGVELWASDGTAAGTRLVRDIVLGPGDSQPVPLVSVNGSLFFRARETELWRSDGTADGTRQLAQLLIDPYAAPSDLDLVALGNRVFFLSQGSESSADLWVTDGTPAGTKRLAPIVDNFWTRSLAASDTMVVFSGAGAETGSEPWKTDGTPDGTTLVANIAPESQTQRATPVSLTDLNGTLLFFAAGDGTYGLWRSDGTEAGTMLLKSGASGAVFGPALAIVGNSAYFAAYDGTPAGLELWRTDGTLPGTQRVAVVARGAATIDPLISIGETIFFVVRDDRRSALWKSDGTSDGTLALKVTGSPVPRYRAILGGNLYFDLGTELWKSDGSSEGTVRVLDFSTRDAIAIDDLAVVGGTLFVGTRSTQPAHGALWTTDGTAAGTEAVPSFDFEVVPGTFRAANDVLFFLAFGREESADLVWRSDGTDGGTFSLVPFFFGFEAISTALSGVVPHWGFHPIVWPTAVFDDVFWFGLTGGVSRSDGTVEGAVLVRDDVYPLSLANAGGKLLFNGCTADLGCELWESDGTALGTRQLADIGGPLSSNPDGFTAAGSLVFFSADAPETGRELWAVPIAALGDCGDGEVDPGEGCDEGGQTAACDADCSLSECGDGHTNSAAGEECDVDNPSDADCCTVQCRFSASGVMCADGNLCSGADRCDDGGHCLPGTALSCIDDEPRTIDSCFAPIGCVHLCSGDCDRSGVITIEELVTMVSVALSGVSSPCTAAGDVNGDGAITIDEITGAVRSALVGCPSG